jgi:hypothetical protein
MKQQTANSKQQTANSKQQTGSTSACKIFVCELRKNAPAFY